jgi:hypothetical protein
MRQWITIALLALLPACVSACDLVSLPVSGNQVQAGKTRVTLGEADDSQHPAAWQGPLQVQAADGRTCTVSEDVAIIEKPLLLGNGHILFVPTYSGSTNRVYAVDLQDCRVRWKSLEFSGATSQANNVLIMGRTKTKLPKSCVR